MRHDVARTTRVTTLLPSADTFSTTGNPGTSVVRRREGFQTLRHSALVWHIGCTDHHKTRMGLTALPRRAGPFPGGDRG
jgi:hypothetical protein